MKLARISLEDVHHRLQPVLDELEVEREKLAASRKKGLWYLAVGALVIVIAGVVKNYSNSSQLDGIAIGAIIFAALYLIIALVLFTNKWKEVKNLIKQRVISEVVTEIDPSMRFDARDYISRDDFRATKLFSRPDRYNGEDMIMGTYGKTDFMMSEIHAERESRDSDGNSSYSTIFKGFMLIADFHKDFIGETFVLPDRWEGIMGTWLSKGAQKLFGRGQLVYLENVEFEKEFKVYSSDQVEARYILTPKLMEALLELKRQFNSPIRVSFRESLLAIAIQWPSDYLEPDLYSKEALRDSVWLKNLVDDIYLGLDIIEQLDLNTRIWTKD